MVRACAAGAALVLLVGACGASPPPPTPTPAAGAPGTSPAGTQLASPEGTATGAGAQGGLEIFGPVGDDGLPLPTQPAIDVVPVLASSGSVTTPLALDAATTLETAGPDGTRYTLVVPAGAVPGGAVVSMTPLAAVKGLPLDGGLIGGVQLAPDGLVLDLPATLTIVPAGELPAGGVVGFDYLGRGDDLALVPSTLADRSIAIDVWHFSGSGAGKGSQDSIAEQVRREIGDRERAFLHAIAATQALERGCELTFSDCSHVPSSEVVAANLWSVWWETILEPLWKNAASSCDDLLHADRSTRSIIRQMETLIGLEGASVSAPDAAAIAGYRKPAVDACLEEMWRRCEAHDLGVIPELLAWDRQEEVSSHPDPRWEARARDCARWEVKLESEATIRGNGRKGGRIEQGNTATGSAFVRAMPAGGFRTAEGSGPEPMKVEVSGSTFSLTGVPRCTGKMGQDAVTGAQVTSLTLITSDEAVPPKPGARAGLSIKEVHLGFDPGEDVSSARISCGSRVPPFEASFRPWNLRWLVHREKDGESGEPEAFLRIRMSGTEAGGSGAVIARKTYDRTVEVRDADGRITERTSITIFHRPEKSG